MNKTIIIAEAGVNHNGDIELAKKLINIADESGADYVKFQLFKAGNIVSKVAEKAGYQKQGTQKDETQLEMLLQLELNAKEHEVLLNFCGNKRVKFLSSAFDLESLEYINQLNLDYIKVPSGEINNKPYLEKVASFGNKIILSTGMSNLQEIRIALNILIENGANKDEITVLHCNTEYPTPIEDVNLNAMGTIKNELNINVGYSDHTLGLEVPIAAVALGAAVVEKHFTIDRAMQGPDHKSSLTPTELTEMVKGIRNIELAMGSGVKEASRSELINKEKVRKSIHVVGDICKGHILAESDLIMKRPGDGISPMEIDSVIGKELNISLKDGDKLERKHLV